MISKKNERLIQMVRLERFLSFVNFCGHLRSKIQKYRNFFTMEGPGCFCFVCFPVFVFSIFGGFSSSSPVPPSGAPPFLRYMGLPQQSKPSKATRRGVSGAAGRDSGGKNLGKPRKTHGKQEPGPFGLQDIFCCKAFSCGVF